MKLDEIDLNTLISTPERRAQFKQVLDRGLNTWDGAPQWLFELADAVAGDAKLQAAPQAQAGPTIEFDDPRVQTVYSLLCSDEAPPREEHWEGWAARRIVGALQQPAQGMGEVGTVQIVGVKAGIERNLGSIPMPPRMKARELAVEQFGHFEDDDGSDAELCFGALEQLIDHMIAAGWKIPTPSPEAAPDSAFIEALLDEADEWAGYVTEDHAPMTLRKFLERKVAALSTQPAQTGEA